jgi:hypothetical protein
MQPLVGLHTVTNTNVPQVTNLNPSNTKVTRLEKSIKGASNSDHTPINQYLQYPIPLMPKTMWGQD